MGVGGSTHCAEVIGKPCRPGALATLRGHPAVAGSARQWARGLLRRAPSISHLGVRWTPVELDGLDSIRVFAPTNPTSLTESGMRCLGERRCRAWFAPVLASVHWVEVVSHSGYLYTGARALSRRLDVAPQCLDPLNPRCQPIATLKDSCRSPVPPGRALA